MRRLFSDIVALCLTVIALGLMIGLLWHLVRHALVAVLPLIVLAVFALITAAWSALKSRWGKH